MPLGSRHAPVLAAALAAFVGAAAPTPAASEETHVEAFWVEASASGGRAGRAVPALLELPPGWMAGDAAAVVLSDRPWPGLARERLIGALLDEGAAVLAIDAGAARGSSPENAHAGPPRRAAAELMADLRDAVEALQRDAAAGLVVALGHVAGGDAAVLAAAAARAERGGSGVSAGASLGPGPATVVLGGVPSGGDMGVHRGWPVRAQRLCRVLAATAVPSDARAEAECRRALVGPGEARSVRVAGP